MDWPQLIAELIAAGMTQTEIATECGVRQSTVSELSRGTIKSPSFELGTRLVALHALRKAAPGKQDAPVEAKAA